MKAPAALAVLLAYAVCAAAQEAAVPAGPEAAASGLLAADLACREGRDRPWPGYALLDSPVLLYRRQPPLAVLAGSTAAPAGFLPFVPEGYSSAVYVSTAPLAGLDSVFYPSYDLGGLEVFAVPYDGDGEEEAVRTAVHERFHAYQGSLGRGDAFADMPYAPPPGYEDLTPENMALAAVEQACLARALLDGAADAAAVKDFIAVRALRRAKAGPEWAPVEDELERDEGTADYATARVLDAAYGSGWGTLQLASDLLRPDDGDALEEMTHGRLYMTGEAMSRLLDRRLPGWKRRAAAGESLFSLLKKAAPAGRAELDRRAAAAMKAYSYPGLLEEAGSGLSDYLAGSARAFRDFAAYTGPRLLLRVADAADAAVSFSSVKTYRLGERTELFVDNPVYEFSSPGARLLVKDATLRVFRGEDGFALYDVILSSAPRLTAGGAERVPAAAPEELSDVKVEAPGLWFSAPRASVRAGDGAVAVDVP